MFGNLIAEENPNDLFYGGLRVPQQKFKIKTNENIKANFHFLIIKTMSF